MSTPKEILVIDDEPDICQLLADILTSQGHNVTCASDGLQGLNELSKKKYDMAVTDMLMPEHDGIEFIRAAQKKHPEVRLVAISGGGHIPGASYLSIAKGFGVKAIVEKPFDVESILTVINPMFAVS